MKKLSLFIVSFLFSLGIMAQTTPATNSNPQQLQTAPPSTTTGAKTTKPATGLAKNNLKKTTANKKATHHVTPVKKAGAPVSKSNSADSLKR